MRPDQEVEAGLARRLMSGDPQAFDPFVEHFRNKVFQYSWLMCGQREDAEDVAQETLLNVFRSFDKLRDPERVRPWVFRIAKNACLTKRRRSIFAPTPSQELSLDELMPSQDGHKRLEIPDWSSIPEAQAMQGETKQHLEKAIRELPEIYRSVILLRDVEGLTTGDAAQVLDVTEDVIKTRLHRARLAVRKHLEERLGAHAEAR